MKKIVFAFIIIFLFLAGGGVYYYFMMNDGVVQGVVVEKSPIEKEESIQEEIKSVVEPNMDYYVTALRLNVYPYPRISSLARATLRKGEQIKVLEIKDGWARLSDYEVHKSGQDIADWVNMDFLSHDKQEVTPQEINDSMRSLIHQSDDFDLYEERFITATKQLIDDNTCTYEDFELMDGWLSSRIFKAKSVYFVYCNGTMPTDKVYLDVESGDIFQP